MTLESMIDLDRKSDYSSHHHLFVSTEDYSGETSTGNEPFNVDHRGRSNRQGDNTVISDNSYGYSQRQPLYVHGQQYGQPLGQSHYPPLHATTQLNCATRHNLSQYHGPAGGSRLISNPQGTTQYDGFNPAILTSTASTVSQPYYRSQDGDQYLQIGGQFVHSAGTSGHADGFHGPCNVAQNMGHGVESEQRGAQSLDGWDSAPAYHGQESILMTSLGRGPGYQTELARVMEQECPVRTQYPGENYVGHHRPIDPALNDCHHEVRPPIQQSNTGRVEDIVNGILPNIVVNKPEHPDPFSSFPPDHMYHRPVSKGQTQPHVYLQPPGHAPSPSSSVSTSDTFHCPYEGCAAEFNKKWRKNNLSRHLRLKHKNGGKRYECEADNCKSVYQRQDARLKHYRVEHPYLAPKPVVLRKKSSSTGTGSGWKEVGRSQSSYSQTSPCDSQDR